MRQFLLILCLIVPAGAAVPALLKQGNDACADGLWDVAALRYEQLLRDPELAKPLRAEVAIRLAEAWIRSGQATKALDLLADKQLPPQPATYFWNAQALAATGHLTKAVEALAPALEQADAAFRTEAILTRASLQLALNQSTEALLTLKALTTSRKPETAALARLRQAEILLDQGDVEGARAIIPATVALVARYRPETALVRARIAVAEGNPGDAIPVFADLLEQPENQSLTRFCAAAIGLADSLAAQGDPTAAANSLLAFIGDRPEPPWLDLMFERILRWLPDPPQADDPILVRVAGWIPPLPPPPPAMLNTSADSATSAWPAWNEELPLAPYAIHTLALALGRIDTPQTQAESRTLLTRLQLEFPQHPLAHRALLAAARSLLAKGEIAQALAVLKHFPSDPSMQGKAEFLTAQAAFLEGDPSQAIALFDAAAKTLDARDAETARLNAAIIRLSQGIALPATQAGTPPLLSPDLSSDLQLEQALAIKDPAAARNALDAFLTGHPDHPRQAEARLAAAEAAIASTPPDLANARARLATLAAADPGGTKLLPPARLALVKLRLTDLSNKPEETAAAAKAFLEVFPTDPAAPDVSLLLGRSLYQAGEYNQARMTLEKLAATDTTATRAQAAWLLAARAAALVPSPQSREEALALFDQTIATDGPLATIAKLEKARLMLDLNRLPEAITFLRAWLKTLPKNDPLHLPAGFLLGEAVTLAAGDSPQDLAEALAIYQNLLTHPAADDATRNRLKFLSGQMLEQLPDPKNPGENRIPEAIEAYYSVLETAAKTPPTEWVWFERCGFKALELYAAAERWQSAIAIAKKIASCRGPRAEEAANQARILQLKHMVWED